MARVELGETEKSFFKEIIAHEAAKTIIQAGAFQLFFEEPITFSFGIKSPLKVEVEKICQSPRELKEVVGLLGQLMDIEGLGPKVIVGVISGGVPFARELAQLKNCRFAARLGRKRTEIELRQVGGIVKPGEEVLIFDDVCTTGGNIILAAEDVRREEGIVSSVLSLFDYGFQIARENLAQHHLVLHGATQFSILLDLATKPGYSSLGPGDFEYLSRWHKSIQESSR